MAQAPSQKAGWGQRGHLRTESAGGLSISLGGTSGALPLQQRGVVWTMSLSQPRWMAFRASFTR
jgi:hypothetical protein